MIRLCQEYVRPDSVEEALEALTGSAGVARLVAGGTDLFIDLQQGRHPPVQRLVDVSNIARMQAVEETDEGFVVGAALPLRQMVRHPVVRAHAQGLVEAGGLIGGPQVRAVATLGGNVGHALPAGDGTIALLSLGAEALLASPESERWVSVESLFRAPGETTFDRRREMIVAFRMAKRRPGEGTAFQRVMRPQGVAIAILNMGVWLRMAGGKVDDLRIAIGPAGPRPVRARRAEASLKGSALEPDDFEAASQALLEEVHLRTSPHRATADYRRHLTSVLLRATLSQAQARASADAVVA